MLTKNQQYTKTTLTMQEINPIVAKVLATNSKAKRTLHTKYTKEQVLRHYGLLTDELIDVTDLPDSDPTYNEWDECQIDEKTGKRTYYRKKTIEVSDYEFALLLNMFKCENRTPITYKGLNILIVLIIIGGILGLIAISQLLEQLGVEVVFIYLATLFTTCFIEVYILRKIIQICENLNDITDQLS